LTRSYKLIFHQSFQKQALKIKGKYPKIEKPLMKALDSVKANPLPGTLQGITIPYLKGIIHKKHVGGPTGHRLIYLFFNRQGIVIPIFVSEEKKAKFSYDKIDWQKVCAPIYQDFKNKNYKAFAGWK